jgi:hypothetical protein
MHYEPRRILATLAAHSVDSLLIGGVARVVHGSIRTTEDVATLCHARPDNLARLASALTALEARVRGSSRPPGPIAPELLEGTSLITFETRHRARIGACRMPSRVGTVLTPAQT